MHPRPTSSAALLVLACTAPAACTGESARGEAAPAAESPPVQLSVGQKVRLCETTSTFFGGTAIADREDWYGRHLRAMGERPLCTDDDAPRKVYRFSWLPSFHAPVVVRVEVLPHGSQLHATLGGGAGGLEVDRVTRDTVLMLQDAEARYFAAQVNGVKFWFLPAVDPAAPIGLDGAQWIMEGLDGARYHVVDRWSPPAEEPYRKLGEWLLSRSGLVPADLVRGY